ncbi:MAG: hypothetical protein A3J49_15180 [Gallionellales bacterium RIFCSPHIGHO2_02_FULL_57_16]|nr:MAG: hypothetical protein A3J49_15180 [Gallionellales bacterium RIFCSPHIGHO2_02_FULL_57_16]
MSLIDTDKFNPLALKWLLRHIEFDFDAQNGYAIEALPCIVREQVGGLWLYRWRLPLTGDASADCLLSMEMGLGFIKALEEYEPVDELDPAPESMAGIFEAMQRGLLSFSGVQAVGFFGVVESFLECALNHPAKFERLRARLRRLTADKLRERCKCILAGQIPPDFFSDDAT